MQNAGFATQVLVPDLKQWYRDRQKNPPVAERGGSCGSTGAPAYPTPANYTYGTMAGYHTYQQMLDVLDDMAAKFPNLITARAAVSDTIVTWEGRPLWYVKISDNANVKENETEILYTALHHAREPNSASQMLFYMWYLLENYATDPEIKYIVDNEELYFIPCVNPDGYVWNETTDPDGYGFWRKNRRDNGDGTMGVDLNRNYGYFWGFTDQGSSPSSGSEVYRGPEPFSEPETRSVRDFCLNHEFIFTLNYHTSGNLLIYPWAYSDTPADSSLITYAQLFTRFNKYKYGTSTETVGYSVNGSSDDWMYGEKGTMSYTPEVGTTGFWPSFDEIDGLNRDNMWPNLSLALSALHFGELTDLSESFISQVNTTLPLRIQRFGQQEGSFKVTLTPVSAGIVSPAASQTFNLGLFKTADFNFPVTLDPGLTPGTDLEFLLELSNGVYTRTDTLRKTFLGNVGSLAILYENSADNFAGWEGTFELTTETYVSAPACFTDSPNGFYLPNAYSIYYTEDPVEIPADAAFARLRFFARWDIENDRDFAQVFSLNESGVPTALCGLYTNLAAGFPQPDNQPVYDGKQLNWVEEEVDLTDYIGQAIRVGFLFQSDDFLERDGFYVDDIVVEYADKASSVPVTLSPGTFRLLQNQPNPAAGTTTIRWAVQEELAGAADLVVLNGLGETMLVRPVRLGSDTQARIDTGNWPAGVYTYLLRNAGGQTRPMKMTVMH